jgi:hypothetical protein
MCFSLLMSEGIHESDHGVDIDHPRVIACRVDVETDDDRQQRRKAMTVAAVSISSKWSDRVENGPPASD